MGCDGGRSVVAEQGGIERSGADFDQVVALAVFRSPELDGLLERFPPRSTYRVVAPYLKGYWAFFGRIDDEGSFFFHAPLPEGSTPEDLDVAADAAPGRRPGVPLRRWTTSASGTCACRSPAGTGPAGRSSPATPPTPTRPTAGSG